MTDIYRNFIDEHIHDDINKLILNASRYKGIDVKFAAEQIEAGRNIKEKLPSWYENKNLVFPSKLSTEQCSSEIAAAYKQRFVNEDDIVCDMTGGLGVDTCYFARKAKKVIYLEQNAHYCEVASNNFNELGISNVEIINADALTCFDLDKLSDVSVFYIDPSRRGGGNKRLYALEDCEPELTKIWTALLKRNCKIIAKLSPMLDISHILNQLPKIGEIHVLSIKNDCKELIIVSETNDVNDCKISCINFLTDGKEQTFTYHWNDEKTSMISYASEIKKYLYEPNASVMKAGAYKSVAALYNPEKLHPSSHLYTSDLLVENFAGRKFEVLDVYIFNNQVYKELQKTVEKANITIRNFPISAEELRKRLKINDGGDIYLFATTLSNNKKVLIKCRKE